MLFEKISPCLFNQKVQILRDFCDKNLNLEIWTILHKSSNILLLFIGDGEKELSINFRAGLNLFELIH